MSRCERSVTHVYTSPRHRDAFFSNDTQYCSLYAHIPCTCMHVCTFVAPQHNSKRGGDPARCVHAAARSVHVPAAARCGWISAFDSVGPGGFS
eukprot:4750297-Pleurochrysis_carterae.AAC.2